MMTPSENGTLAKVMDDCGDSMIIFLVVDTHESNRIYHR